MRLRPTMSCGFLHAVNVKIVKDISEVWIWYINLLIDIIIVFRVNIKKAISVSPKVKHMRITDNGNSYPKLEMTGSCFGPKKCHL